jgi:hypothetical protein
VPQLVSRYCWVLGGNLPVTVHDDPAMSLAVVIVTLIDDVFLPLVWRKN